MRWARATAAAAEAAGLRRGSDRERRVRRRWVSWPRRAGCPRVAPGRHATARRVQPRAVGRMIEVYASEPLSVTPRRPVAAGRCGRAGAFAARRGAAGRAGARPRRHQGRGDFRGGIGGGGRRLGRDRGGRHARRCGTWLRPGSALGDTDRAIDRRARHGDNAGDGRRPRQLHCRSPRRRGWQIVRLVAIVAFLLGLAVTVYRHAQLRRLVRERDDDSPARRSNSPPVRAARRRSCRPRRCRRAVRAPIDLETVEAREVALTGRIAELEVRLASTATAAQAAAGNANRAEGLLVAFAARRALDRGLGLGLCRGPVARPVRADPGAGGRDRHRRCAPAGDAGGSARGDRGDFTATANRQHHRRLVGEPAPRNFRPGRDPRAIPRRARGPRTG